MKKVNVNSSINVCSYRNGLKLKKALNQVATVLESMDEQEFKAIEEILGKDYYDNIIQDMMDISHHVLHE